MYITLSIREREELRLFPLCIDFSCHSVNINNTCFSIYRSSRIDESSNYIRKIDKAIKTYLFRSMMFVFLFVLTFLTCSSSDKNPTIVPVKLFVPQPIRVTLDDLPPPYHTTSAQKPSIVVPIPSNATLLVPDLNFRVSIYREEMNSPRNMIYTPTGDILVTEMRGDRISILSGDNTAIFADSSNRISRAFGMAFVKVCLM